VGYAELLFAAAAQVLSHIIFPAAVGN